MATASWEDAKKYALAGGSAKFGDFDNYAKSNPTINQAASKMASQYGPPRPGTSTQAPSMTTTTSNPAARYAATYGPTAPTNTNMQTTPTPAASTPKPTYKAILDSVLERMNSPQPTFQYNPQGDASFQAASRLARQGVGTAQANTNARLRATGQGKSSYSESVANQIAQRAEDEINTKLLPQYEQMAYGRFNDEQTRARQSALDMLSIGQGFNTLDQQELDNSYRNRTFDRNVLENDRAFDRGILESDRAFDRNALESDRSFGEQRKQNNLDAAFRVGQQTGRVIQPKEDYSLLYNQEDAPLNLQGEQLQYQQYRDQIADEQYKQKFDEDVRRFGLNYAMEQAQFNNQVKQQGVSNQLSRERFNFEKDQTLEKRSQSDAARTLQSDVVAGLGEFDNPEEATQWLNANAAEITRQLGPEGYQDLLGLVPRYFGVDSNASKANVNLRQDAAKMAQEDSRWFKATTQQEKNALVNEYVAILQGG